MLKRGIVGLGSACMHSAVGKPVVAMSSKSNKLSSAAVSFATSPSVSISGHSAINLSASLSKSIRVRRALTTRQLRASALGAAVADIVSSINSRRIVLDMNLLYGSSELDDGT